MGKSIIVALHPKINVRWRVLLKLRQSMKHADSRLRDSPYSYMTHATSTLWFYQLKTPSSVQNYHEVNQS